MYTFRIEIYIGKLLISGNYDMQNYRRLSDALNSDFQRYFTLTNAIIAPIHRPQKAERVARLLVDHSKIVMVAPLREPDPPAGFAKEQFITPRDIEPAMFFTSDFAIQGNYFKRPDLALDESLNQAVEDFLPVRQARVFPIDGGSSWVRDFVSLGRVHIEAAYAMASHESI